MPEKTNRSYSPLPGGDSILEAASITTPLPGARRMVEPAVNVTSKAPAPPPPMLKPDNVTGVSSLMLAFKLGSKIIGVET